MATTPPTPAPPATTPDQRTAKNQLRQLRWSKQALQDEKALLQTASVRIPEINDEIDAINAEIDRIKLRDPDEQNLPSPPAVAQPGNRGIA